MGIGPGWGWVGWGEVGWGGECSQVIIEKVPGSRDRERMKGSKPLYSSTDGHLLSVRPHFLQVPNGQGSTVTMSTYLCSI